MLSLGEYLPANNLFILISGLVILLVSFAMFMRKRRNRHPMEGQHGRDLEERRARMNAQSTTDVPPTRQ